METRWTNYGNMEKKKRGDLYINIHEEGLYCCKMDNEENGTYTYINLKQDQHQLFLVEEG